MVGNYAITYYTRRKKLKNFVKYLLVRHRNNIKSHKDSRASRIDQDDRDVELIINWLIDHSPKTENLMSLSTGIIANEKINCHKTYEIGMIMMSEIAGTEIEKFSFKRKQFRL